MARKCGMIQCRPAFAVHGIDECVLLRAHKKYKSYLTNFILMGTLALNITGCYFDEINKIKIQKVAFGMP